MNRFILYADWKHGDEHEYLNIYLDIELNNEAKTVLLKYLNNYLNKTFDLSYVDSGDPFILTRRELDRMLTEREYTFGEIDNTYLFPTSVRVEIKKDTSISLKQLMLL